MKKTLLSYISCVLIVIYFLVSDLRVTKPEDHYGSPKEGDIANRKHEGLLLQRLGEWSSSFVSTPGGQDVTSSFTRVRTGGLLSIKQPNQFFSIKESLESLEYEDVEENARSLLTPQSLVLPHATSLKEWVTLNFFLIAAGRGWPPTKSLLQSSFPQNLEPFQNTMKKQLDEVHHAHETISLDHSLASDIALPSSPTTQLLEVPPEKLVNQVALHRFLHPNLHSNNQINPIAGTAENISQIASPVILVPGFGGSSLYASLKSANISSCSPIPITVKKEKLWAPLHQWLRGSVSEECWAEKVTLLYASHNNTYYDRPGVEVYTSGFGPTRDMDWLEYFLNVGVPGTEYMHKLTETLRAAEIPFYGASYDWRLPPWQMNWSSMKDFIEEIVARHNGRRVTMVGHSYGALMLNYFLNKEAATQWKDSHIHQFISVCGAFGGSFTSLRALLSGIDPMPTGIMRGNRDTHKARLALREMERSLASLYVLLPSQQIYHPDRVVVQLVNFNCTSEDYEEEQQSVIAYRYTMRNFTDLFSPEMKLKAVASETAIKTAVIGDPKVRVVCLWSELTDDVTEGAYIYSSLDMEKEPQSQVVPGDGVLPLESSQYCKKWKSTVVSKAFIDENHTSILSSPSFAELIISLLPIIED